MPKQEKLDTVAEYNRLFKESNSYFVADYQGLTVADMTALRKNLRDNGVRLVIGKNTLFRIAAKDSEVEGIEEHLNGPTAIAFAGEDPAVAAKILHDSYKDKELPRMKAFWVDDQRFEASDIKRLADLPPRDVLLSQVLASVQAPFTSLIGSVEGFFRKLVGTIDALAEKRKGEDENPE